MAGPTLQTPLNNSVRDIFRVFAGWAAEGTVSKTGTTAEVSNAYELLLNALAPYITAYATATPAPAFSESLAIAGRTFVGHLALDAGAIVVLPGALDSVAAYEAAADLTKTASDPGPQGGLLFSDPPLFAIQMAGGRILSTNLVAPPAGQGVFPIAGVKLPPPSEGGVEAGATGTGTGSIFSTFPDLQIACDPNCTGSYPDGQTVVLVANYDTTKNTFIGWSGGGCAGTGACAVHVIGGQVIKVTAAFAPMPEQPEVYSGSFVGQVVDQGNGGCPGSATLGGTAIVNIAPAGVGNGGAFAFTVNINLLQGPGICDVYEGMYTFSGTLARVPGTVMTFSAGLVTVTGAFNLSQFAGAWGFSASVGPDVATGSFSLTKE
jgi:hypothetical protein